MIFTFIGMEHSGKLLYYCIILCSHLYIYFSYVVRLFIHAMHQGHADSGSVMMGSLPKQKARQTRRQTNNRTDNGQTVTDRHTSWTLFSYWAERKQTSEQKSGMWTETLGPSGRHRITLPAGRHASGQTSKQTQARETREYMRLRERGRQASRQAVKKATKQTGQKSRMKDRRMRHTIAGTPLTKSSKLR